MQHTAVVKALEARKRYEKRDERRREEMKTEKWAEHRRELESLSDQRSPTEDMSLTDHKTLPAR